MFDLASAIRHLSIITPPILLALTIHECAHAWVADRLGDPTARMLGRLTLNPLSHLDPVGTIGLFLFRFGWARPVPVMPSNFRDPRRDMVWVALAGPMTNLFLAAISALVLRMAPVPAFPAEGAWWGAGVGTPIFFMLRASVRYNVILAIFNVIPIPPLDGSRMLSGFLGPTQTLAYRRIEPYGVILLVVLIFTGTVGRVIWPMISMVEALLL
ncbi:MAG: site-2 protease family protein [Candidatus Methylomirabilales bacterium]